MNETMLIASDLHGSIAALRTLVDRALFHNPTALFFAGDLCPSDDPLFKPLLAQLPELHLVRGNCDSSWAYSQAGLLYPPRLLFSQWEGRKIALTHGDMFFDCSVLGLSKGDIAITGHSHVPHLYVDEDGVVQINAGSIAQPRSRWGATYALLSDQRATIYPAAGGSPLFSLDLNE
ncbi:MAG: metallophosphoesterase family protein [Sphaerochaeta sp.]|jgi:putative phosphoesterase